MSGTPAPRRTETTTCERFSATTGPWLQRLDIDTKVHASCFFKAQLMQEYLMNRIVSVGIGPIVHGQLPFSSKQCGEMLSVVLVECCMLEGWSTFQCGRNISSGLFSVTTGCFVNPKSKELERLRCGQSGQITFMDTK